MCIQNHVGQLTVVFQKKVSFAFTNGEFLLLITLRKLTPSSIF